MKVALNTITQTIRRSFFIFLMVAYVRPIELQGLYPRISGTSICTIVIYTSQWYCTIHVATLQLFIPYRIFFHKDLNFFIFGTILSHSPLEDQLHLYKSESLLQNDHLYFWFHFCRTVLQEKIKCRKVYTDNGWTTIMWREKGTPDLLPGQLVTEKYRFLLCCEWIIGVLQSR